MIHMDVWNCFFSYTMEESTRWTGSYLCSLSEKALMAWRNNCNRMALADLVIHSCVCIVYAVEILGAVISSTSLFHNTHPCVRQ